MSFPWGTLSLLFLETTFLFVILALLFNQRKNIGSVPFQMAMAGVLIFTMFAIGADLQATLCGNHSFSVPRVVMFAPFLTIYLLVYICEGTLAAQRIIYGGLTLCVLGVYFGEMLILQSQWQDFTLSTGLAGPALEQLLTGNRSTLITTALRLIFDLFWLPMVYTKLTELHRSHTLAVLTALLSAQIAHQIPDWLLLLGAEQTPQWMTAALAARLAVYTWLGLLLSGYLHWMKDAENRAPEGSVLDLFFAFFGSYGRNKQLERKLADWQNRYQIVLEGAAEAIVIFNGDGIITDANAAAHKLFGSFARIGERGPWNKLRDMEPPENNPLLCQKASFTFRCSWGSVSAPVYLYGSVSPIPQLAGNIRVMVLRDITEEKILQAEKQRLADQLAHSQRLESLGILAGGIAHDFNNFIHAILGHVDVAAMRGQMTQKWDEGIEDHLNKVVKIAEKAGTLTRQMLGFARRGNYMECDFDPADALNGAMGLIGPKKIEKVELALSIPEKSFVIHCDQLQFQQTILNIVLNGLYATEQNSGVRKLAVRLTAAENVPDLTPPPDKKPDLKHFCVILISDNGCGMDEATKQKIFEPFFTTKPVGVGTGMGLSMAYGIITGCGGWIEVESAPGKGSTFKIVVPERREEIR